MIAQTCEHDAFSIAARALRWDRPLTIADVGANVGWTAIRAADVWPRAHIHAFEPSKDILPELRTRAAERPGIHVVPIALGDHDGTANLHITANHWCSSLLTPIDTQARARGYLDVDRQDAVAVRTLDAWAAGVGVDHIDVLKIDVQGAELAVLRGARTLLQHGVDAIISEAQIVPQYRDAATLTDIDAYLRGIGYTLHHVATVHNAAPDLRTTHVDAIWLSPAAAERMRSTPAFDFIPTPLDRMTHALTWCAANGHTAVALYGGGQHTRDLLPRLTGAPVNIIAVIDDDPNRQGRTIARVPTIDPSRIDDTVATAIIISSDAAEPALIERSANFAGARPVIRLYGTAATTLCARSGHACVVRPHAELCA